MDGEEDGSTALFLAVPRDIQPLIFLELLVFELGPLACTHRSFADFLHESKEIFWKTYFNKWFAEDATMPYRPTSHYAIIKKQGKKIQNLFKQTCPHVGYLQQEVSRCANQGFLIAVRRLFYLNPVQTSDCQNQVNAFGYPLHCAAKFGCIDTCELLLQLGFKVDVINTREQTVDAVAAASGNIDVLCTVSPKKVCTDEKLLKKAFSCGKETSVMKLIALDALKAPSLSKSGESPLFLCANSGLLGPVTTILSHNWDYKFDVSYALFGAIYRKSVPITKALLQYIKEEPTCIRQGLTPFLYACNLCRLDIIKCLLIAFPNIIYQQTRKQQSSLHLACRKGNFHGEKIDSAVRAATIVYLCTRAPLCLSTPDRYDKTPLDDLLKPNPCYASSMDCASPLLACNGIPLTALDGCLERGVKGIGNLEASVWLISYPGLVTSIEQIQTFIPQACGNMSSKLFEAFMERAMEIDPAATKTLLNNLLQKGSFTTYQTPWKFAPILTKLLQRCDTGAPAQGTFRGERLVEATSESETGFTPKPTRSPNKNKGQYL